MLTTAPLDIASLRLSEFFQANQVSIANSQLRIASGKRINSPSDGSADYFIVQQIRADVQGQQQAGRELSVGGALVDTAKAVGSMVYEDLNRMQQIVKFYYDDGTTDDEKGAYKAEFNAIKNRIAYTINDSSYNGYQLIKDYGSSAMMKIITDPRDYGNTFNISFDAGDVADASGLTLGATNKATEQAAVQQQLDKAASYLAKSTVYCDSISTQQDMLDAKNTNYNENADTIENADEGAEVMAMTKKSLYQQIAVSMMAQANMFKAGIATIAARK